MADDVTIRRSLPADGPSLREVELASGALFAELGMHDVAAAEPGWLDDWPRLDATGLVFVAVERARPVGFAMSEPVDGCLHLEQLSVDPSCGRRGIGTALVERVALEARALGLQAVTLSTFVDVPFNGPLYRRLGFRQLRPSELTPGLALRRSHEATLGLDTTRRAMMRRDVL